MERVAQWVEQVCFAKFFVVVIIYMVIYYIVSRYRECRWNYMEAPAVAASRSAVLTDMSVRSSIGRAPERSFIKLCRGIVYFAGLSVSKLELWPAMIPEYVCNIEGHWKL